MDQKFTVGLNSRLKSFAKKFGIDMNAVPENDFFEAFSNYVVISSLLEEDFENINN